ncbi:hypothetical protein [Paenibacillus alvei]|uniref:hypothetical protein n=1 Tax=Paenibacillus alvei TaxID=44250 RepID=UPI00148BCA3C|nr:hypothetical protein [Paenibacillus alvei]MCY9585211.1 hypothetical protein [Paenibacillus alvei]
MSNASNKKLEMLKQHLQPNQSEIQDLQIKPESPQILQYFNQKLPLNHPLIKSLEEMI